LGKAATEEWCFENANRIVQIATLTGGARDLAISKKLSYGRDIPSAFYIQTKQKKMYLIKGEFNHETELSRCKILFADQYLSVNPGDLWTDIKTTGLDNEGTVDFKNGKKPERLIKRIISMNTNPGDIVLDSFLGSGTTAAVAHKMGRRWIGIEMGDHVYTHCLPRLKNVIIGNDAGGVTKSTGWLCGGGFKFYELASSLIVKDKYGQQIISDKYNADMLAEAMCNILGYHYKPDAEKYWKQGFSSEKSFIYTTTMSMQEESLGKLAAEVGDDNLLICCSAFIGNHRAYPNITVKKIPSAILKKCEWGREGYPLNLKNYSPSDKDFEFAEEE
jgi:adenine-specific DNA-methyltransferase